MTKKRVMKDKEKDRRVIIPKDAFEEEASEGLGRLSREEAEEDLRELKGRMERRFRRPRMIWLPAAAAVVILLVASAVYVSLFRERGTKLSGVTLAEDAEMTQADAAESATEAIVFTDTALIAMAEPIHKSSTSPDIGELRYGQDAAGRAAEGKSDKRMYMADKALPPVITEDDMLALNEVLEVSEGKVDPEEAAPAVVTVQEAVAEEVIVEAIPMMQKASMKEHAETKDERAAATGKPVPAGGAPTAASSRSVTDVIVTGAAVNTTTKPATPAGGYDEFNKWLQQNARYPGEVEPRARQVVVVTFRVSADSTVYDLKAERTAGDLFTREAFRLIREGPKWVPAMRNGQAVEETVRVTVVFK